MEKNYEALETELERIHQKLTQMDPGTDEYKDVLDVYSKLYTQKIEKDKVVSAHEDRKAELNYNYVLKKDEIEKASEQSKLEHDAHRVEVIARLVFEGLLSVGTLYCYNAWMNRGYDFETNGVRTSKTFSDFTKWIKPFTK